MHDRCMERDLFISPNPDDQWSKCIQVGLSSIKEKCLSSLTLWDWEQYANCSQMKIFHYSNISTLVTCKETNVARCPSVLFHVFFIFFSKFYLSINILLQFIFEYPQPLGCNKNIFVPCLVICKSFHTSPLSIARYLTLISFVLLCSAVH